MKCLEKDRARGYETASALALDLQRHRNNEPILARPPSNIYRFQKMLRRNKLAFAATAAVAAAIIAGLGLSTWLFLRERAALKVAAENALWAEHQAQRAEQKAHESRRNLYAADMMLAQAALEAGNIGRAKELLSKYLPRPGERDLRGWEWRYAWNQCRTDELFNLTGHANIVTTLALSPDGRTLASGSYDRTVVLWDLPNKQRIRTIGQSDIVGCIAFANKGRELIVGTRDGRACFWNCDTWEPVTTLSNLSPVLSLKVSPNERTMAVAGRRAVTMWNLADRRELARFHVANENSIPAGVAFSPDSSLLAYSKGDGAIMLWDFAKAKHVAELKGHEQLVCSLAFSPDGFFLVSGGFDQTVRVWDISRQKQLKLIGNFSGWVGCVGFSPDGKMLAVAGSDQRIRLLETQSCEEINSLKGHSDEVWTVVFPSDGKTILTASKDTTIKCWGVSSANERYSQGFPPDVQAVSLLPRGQFLYLMHTNQTYSLWHTDHLLEVVRYAFPLRHFTASTLSPDGSLWLAGSTNGAVKFFDRIKQRFSVDQTYPGMMFSTFAFSANGQMLAGVGNDRTCRVWRIARDSNAMPFASEVAAFGIRAGIVTALQLSRSRGLLGIGYDDGMTEIWSVPIAKRVATLSGHKGHIRSIAISRDDTTAVTGSTDAKVKVWNIKTACETAVIGGQLRAYFNVAFSGDDSRLAACGGDGTVKLWDTTTFQEVASLKIHKYPLYQLAFSNEDEDRLVVAGDDRIFVLRAPNN